MKKKSLMDPVLSLRNVSIRLFDKLVFPNTSWDVFPGEFWAVLGNTGSGKSFFAKILRGDYPITGGEIVYNFKKQGSSMPCDDPEMEIGYVAFDLNREMKSDQNLFVQSRYWSNDESMKVENFLSKEQVYEINPFQILNNDQKQCTYGSLQKKILKLLDIEYLITREINMLSNGECRKLIMARALLKSPSLLILDNPFQGLDTSYRKHLCSIVIPYLQKHGTQIILIVSDPGDIPENVTHILQVSSFKVVSSGPRKQQGSCLHVPVKMTSREIKLPFNFSEKKTSPKAEILVKMTHVSVKYGAKPVLHDINWVVKRGENWAVLGPNGSGKTTLLSLILGDHPQIYSNDIQIFGTRWGSGSNIWDIKKRIGWVSPELQTCYPANEYCYDVVLSGFFDSIGLYKRGSALQHKKVRQIISAFDLTNIEKIPFGSIAEGLQRLVLLMRALVKQPELLILDEPVQGLPVAYRKQMISAVDILSSQRNTAVLYVTHQKKELPLCINKMLILKNGKAKEVLKKV